MPGARRSPGRQARDPADHSRRPNRRVAVEGVRAAVADQPLRIALLDAITGGRLDAPRAQGPDLAPPSYFDLSDAVRARVWENRCDQQQPRALNRRTGSIMLIDRSSLRRPTRAEIPLRWRYSR